MARDIRAMVDCRYEALAEEGHQGAYPTMWHDHLLDLGLTPAANPEMEMEFLDNASVPAGNLSERWHYWLNEQLLLDGTINLSDMWKIYWCGVLDGLYPLPSAFMLDARFDYYLGILDQSLSDGAVLGPAQGVSGGVLVATVGAGWVHTISGNQYHMAAAAAASNRLMSQGAVPFTKGLWIRSKSSATNTPAVSSFTLAFAASNGSTSGKAQIGSNSTTGKIRLRDSSGLVDTAIDYLANETAEMMIIMGETNTAHYYYRSDGVPTWQYVGVQTAFTTPDDNYLAFTALLSDNSIDMLEVGDDGASIIDAKVEALADPDLNSSFWWRSLNDCTLENGELVFPGVVGGYAYHDPADGSGRPDRTLKHNTWYECTFTISEYTGTQGVQIVCGDNQIPRTDRTAVGTYTEILNSGGDGYAGVQSTASDFAGRISYISFKEITAPASLIDNLKGNIVSASFGPAEGPGDLKGPNVITAAIADYDTSGGGSTFDGTHWVVDGTQISFASIGQLGQATVGLTYEMTFEIVEITAGTVSALFGTAIVGSFDTPGVHTIQGEQVGNLGLFMRGDVDFVGKLGVLSVVQVYPNTLVLNDGDELHDDYPANGVGKIRRGILVKNGTTVATLSGGIADTGGVGNDLTEKFTNVPEPGLTLMANAHIPHNSGFFSALATWSRVANPAVNDTDYWYQIRGLSADAGSNMDCRVSDGVGNLETIILPIWLQDEYNRMAMTIGGFDASGQPDPAGPFGCIFKHNDVAVYSSAVQQAAADCFGSGLTSPGRAQYDSLQTKIDKGALATPQRALFNDTFRPVGEELLADPELNDPGAWTQGDGWSVAGGKAVSDGTQVAVSDLRQDGVLIPINSYIETVIDCEAVTGEVFVRYGASAIDSFTTPGIHKIVSQVLAGDILRVRVDAGTTCTLRSVSSKVVDAPGIEGYIPENGVPFVETRGNMEVSGGLLVPASANNWQHIAFDNPGGSFWEMLAACGNTNVHSVGINFRYEANNNHWRAEIRGEGNYILNLYEIISGTNQLRATADTGIAAGPSTFVRVIATDDGENMTVICVDSATVISHASTLDNDKTGAGLELRSGPTAANTKVDWFAARTGSVRAWS